MKIHNTKSAIGRKIEIYNAMKLNNMLLDMTASVTQLPQNKTLHYRVFMGEISAFTNAYLASGVFESTHS